MFRKTCASLCTLTLATSALAEPPARLAEASAPLPAETHAVRLADLERRVAELKEQIEAKARRDRTRHQLLRDAASGPLSSTRATIRFVNELPSVFTVVKATFWLDGRLLYSRSGMPAASVASSLELFTGSITPGAHHLDVRIELQGDGSGVFSYLSHYGFVLRSRRVFEAIDGASIDLAVVGHGRGDSTTPLEERAAAAFQIAQTVPTASRAP